MSAARLQQRLQEYERQYGMTSADFYRRFKAGELGDDVDMVEWSIFYEMSISSSKSRSKASSDAGSLASEDANSSGSN